MTDINVTVTSEATYDVEVGEDTPINVTLSEGISNLSSLSDVTFPFALANGQFLRYNSATGKWINSVYVVDLSSTVQNSFLIPTSEGKGITGAASYVFIGDYDGVGNGTMVQVDDESGIIHFHASVGGITTDCDINTPSVTITTGFSLNGSFNTTIRSISNTYTVSPNDYIVICTSGTFNVTLPNANAFSIGKVYKIKNAGAGTITVNTTSSQTIDGSLTQTLTTNQKITVVSISGNWVTI